MYIDIELADIFYFLKGLWLTVMTQMNMVKKKRF